MKKYVMPITENVELLSGNICQAASPVGPDPLIDQTNMPTAPGRRLTYAD